MSILLHHIDRYAAQKLSASPRAKEMADRAARAAVDEGKQIARDKNPGRAVRCAVNRLRGD